MPSKRTVLELKIPEGEPSDSKVKTLLGRNTERTTHFTQATGTWPAYLSIHLSLIVNSEVRKLPEGSELIPLCEF
jgi:hypothetical protein